MSSLKQMTTCPTTPWAIKTCHFIFHYNSSTSWCIFMFFVPMETRKNTLQRGYLTDWPRHNCITLQYSLHRVTLYNNNAMKWNMGICWVLKIKFLSNQIHVNRVCLNHLATLPERYCLWKSNKQVQSTKAETIYREKIMCQNF